MSKASIFDLSMLKDFSNEHHNKQNERVEKQISLTIPSTRVFGNYKNGLFVILMTNFLNEKYADSLFDLLKKVKYNTDEESKVKIMGREMYIPRKQIAFGDPLVSEYHFAGTKVKANDWTNTGDDINSRAGRELKEIGLRISKLSLTNSNYVLVNNYLDNTNSIGYHSDDEKDLEKESAITGLSLGQERQMYFKSNSSGEVIKIPLPHNSVYIMFYPTNKNWKHSIPKTTTHLGQRISLTFRHII